MDQIAIAGERFPILLATRFWSPLPIRKQRGVNLDTSPEIREAMNLVKEMNAKYDDLDATYGELHGGLPEFVKDLNVIAESANTELLNKTEANLRNLQVKMLQLDLGIDETVSSAGTLGDTLDAIDTLIAGGQSVNLTLENQNDLLQLRLFRKRTERKLEYYRTAGLKTNGLLRRMEEMISETRAQVDEAKRETFRHKIEIYGAVTSAFVATFAGVTIGLEVLRALKVI